MSKKLVSADINSLRAYKQLDQYEKLQKAALVISKRMLKAAGKVTPTELGVASVLCLELSLLLIEEANRAAK